MRRRLFWLIPLALFVLLAMFMANNLGQPQQAVVRSHMIGKPLPSVALEALDGSELLNDVDLRTGRPVLVNLFASWCLPCAVEAPQLTVLGAKVPLYGIAVRDDPAAVASFLQRHGNPFSRIGLDARGSMMLAVGASGVPETYVVDGQGIIRYQHLGEIRAEHVPVLLAEMDKAR